MKAKFRIKKGDKVSVIAGACKGQEGNILSIDRKKNRVYIEGLSKKVKKHVKPQSSKANPEGGIVELDYGVHISNVMLIDETSGKPTKVGYKFDENNNKVRFAKKSGEIIK